jgi:hypothetical protein
MGRCRYMLDIKHMVNSDRFKVTPYKNAIVIDDFYSSEDSGKEIYGLCSTLSFKVARELEKKLGNKYKCLVISGEQKSYSLSMDQKSGMPHFCVAVCRNNHSNLNSIDSLPDDTLIIDPSFGLLGLRKDKVFKDYNFEKIEKPQNFSRPDICYVFYDERDATLLGKVELLAPGLFKEIKSLDKNALIRFLFSEPYASKPPKLYLCTHSKDGVSYLGDSVLEKSLTKEDPLKQWIDKVYKTMQSPVDKNFSVFNY